MEVYDVEVLGATIADAKISNLLEAAQRASVEAAIALSAEEQNLTNTEQRVDLQGHIAELETSLAIRKLDLVSELEQKQAEAKMAVVMAEVAQIAAELAAEVEAQKGHDAVAAAVLTRRKNEDTFTLEMEEKRVEFFKAKFTAITPDLVAAMTAMSQTDFATKLSIAIAPLAINEQIGLSTTLERFFKNTPLENILDNLKRPALAGK